MNNDDCHKQIVIADINKDRLEYSETDIDDEKLKYLFPTLDNAEMALIPFGTNKVLCKKIKQLLNFKGIKAAAEINALNKLTEPFGEISFTELIAEYDKMTASADEYADLYILKDMQALTDMRAALISAKKTEKPVYVFVKAGEDGKTEEFDVPLLSALITAQEMGASAFGISGCSDAVIDELLKYTKIPVISDNRYLRNMYEIKDDFFVFTHYNNIYFLEADTAEISEPVPCLPDMEEIINDVCKTSCDILRVEINTCDDAIDFSQNAHMCTLPVMFMSENELALKMALMLYQGIAMIDSSTMIPQETLDEICKKYGAVVY